MYRSAQINRISQSGALLPVTLLVVGALCIIFSSPKWLFPIAAWIGPACFLYYVQYTTISRKWLWLLLTFVPASVVAQIDVMPFPWFVMIFVVLIDGLKLIAIYALHRWLVGSQPRFVTTLAFPALWTVREFIETQGAIGTFASVANTQYPFPWLVQLASATGLWGITFLLYWFASAAVWAIQARLSDRPIAAGVGLYMSILVGVLSFGAYRYSTNEAANAPKLTVGGVTVPNLPILEALYQDETGQSIQIDPNASPASAQLQTANQGLAAFIKNSNSVHFQRGKAAIQRQQDDLFALSKRAIQQGAKLVLWSEGSALLLKSDEPQLVARGRAFAARNRVYLLMAAGVLLPGKLTPGRLFLENKTVLIDPSGQVINVFHKNHPVPMAEPSRPGDGTIPAIPTPYGRIAPSICYDAEHVGTMRQLSQKQIGLLLLPSGDWHAIAPYHSYMAVFRAVENGCSLARQVSGGLSVFADYRGKVLAQNDYFSEGDKLTVVELPIATIPTVYSRFGDWLAYISLALLVGFSLNALVRIVRKRQCPPFGVGMQVTGKGKTHVTTGAGRF